MWSRMKELLLRPSLWPTTQCVHCKDVQLPPLQTPHPLFKTFDSEQEAYLASSSGLISYKTPVSVSYRTVLFSTLLTFDAES